MSTALEAVLAVCALALTVALAAALLALRRLVRRADGVLGMLEQELRPLIGEIRRLSAEIHGLTRDAQAGLRQIESATERVNVILGGVSGVVGALGGLTRTGQLVSLAVGLKRGVGIFVHRLRKGQGNHHGQ
jgi:hypothetical protein